MLFCFTSGGKKSPFSYFSRNFFLSSHYHICTNLMKKAKKINLLHIHFNKFSISGSREKSQVEV